MKDEGYVAMTNNKGLAFATFLVVNLSAAYVPAFFWVPDLPGTASEEWKFLISPVAFILLWINAKDVMVCWVVLGIFFLSIGLLSAVLYRSRTAAWLFVPSVIFVISLLQGLLFAEIIRGIDGIGG